jgi:hypothetical protein
MHRDKVEAAKALDWSERTSSLPKEGVTYPKGQDRAELIVRMRKAFQKVKAGQTA